LRYALVEIVNLHDEALAFEPIHRILFEIKNPAGLEDELELFFQRQVEISTEKSYEDLKKAINARKKKEQLAGVILKNTFKLIRFLKPSSNLTVGTIQPFLDKFIGDQKAQGLDYVHGDDSLWQLVRRNENNAGIYLPALEKNELFPTVILDGALPRKTFPWGKPGKSAFIWRAGN